MHHDFKVEAQGNIFNVNKVIFHSLDHFINVFSVSELYHSPGSDTGFNLQEIFELMSLLQNAVNIVLSFGPGTDQAHFPP